MVKKYFFIPIALGCLALSWLAQYRWAPDGWNLRASGEKVNVVSEIAPVSGVRISEIMSSNRSAWSDDEGKYADYAEVYNAGGEAVDIGGWTLTDNPNKRIQFTFPAHTLAPGDSVLVYCDGQLSNTYGAAYHAPFKLSAQGDALMLYDGSGSIMESINIPALSANQVYARADSAGAFSVSDQYTPGKRNTEENHRALTEAAGASDSQIVINELMAENRTTLKDADGDYSDWIELYNMGGTPVSLAGYCLSDRTTNPHKWRLPDVTMQPGEYLVLFASGKNNAESGQLHANFKLNGERETVTLTDDRGLIASQVSYELLKADKSVSRKADGSYTLGMAPTPGASNQ